MKTYFKKFDVQFDSGIILIGEAEFQPGKKYPIEITLEKAVDNDGKKIDLTEFEYDCAAYDFENYVREYCDEENIPCENKED